MIAIERTISDAYTDDVDYAAFRGRVVAEFTVKRVDRRRNCTIHTTYEVIDIGRPDPIVPSEPERQLENDPWEPEYNMVNLSLGPEARKRKAAERFAEIQMQVSAYLRQYGPSHVKGIALNLEHKRTTLSDLMRRFEGITFCKVGTCGPAVLWGVVGIHDKEAAL